MKNKFILFGLSVAMMAFAGCSNDDTTPVPPPPDPIEIPEGLPDLPDRTDVCSGMDDDVLIKYCRQNFDKDGDGKVSLAEADNATVINLTWSDVASLKGLCYFRNLVTLTITGNNVSALDEYGNENLDCIDCASNKFTSLNVSKYPNLKRLYCSKNPLTELNVSENGAITILECMQTSLTSLDVSKCPKLMMLNCGSNPDLKELWLAEEQEIKNLSMGGETEIKRKE